MSHRLLLLHPPVAPWLRSTPRGLEVVLLVDAPLRAGQAVVRSLPDNEELLTPLVADGSDGGLQRWRAEVAWDRGNELTLYAFRVDHDGGRQWLAADGLHPQVPREAQHFRVHPNEQPPDWVHRQVFYQIFPDRFARGRAASAGAPDRSGERLFGARLLPVVQVEWGHPIDSRHGPNTFHGGDLSGITERLPYLAEDLGVSALYLNPIFSAASNHRYDTIDYDTVDPHLGGNGALRDLRRETRSRGMRLVLDAVVNHTGVDHPWFNRWGRHPEPGAAQSPASRWRNWYAFDEQQQPVGWKGHDSLPVLDFSSPSLQQAIYGAPDSVLRRWLRPPYEIDGWRLDVIHMLGEGPGARNNAFHVRRIRQAMRAENPQAYVLGEHFSEATRWLQGDQEDGAMNYHGFAEPVRSWLAGTPLPEGDRLRLSTADTIAWLSRAMADIPYANQLAQLNLLDSHDTPRLLSEVDGSLAVMQLAVTMLFTWPGVPCIYYGDEIGLAGGPDPDCRRCFDWDRDHWAEGLWTHYQTLARSRRARTEWQSGAMLWMGSGADWLAYARFDDRRASIVIVNRGPGTRITLPLRALPLPALHWRSLGGVAAVPAGQALEIDVPAQCSRILTGDAG